MPSQPAGREPRLHELYAARQYRPLWLEADTHSDTEAATRQARELVGLLNSAGVFGLTPKDYDAQSLQDLLTHWSVEGPSGVAAERYARFDVSLAEAALHLVHDLHYGRADPRRAGFFWPAARPALADQPLLQTLSTAPSVRAELTSIEPQFLHYQLLEQALPRYRTLAAQPGLTDLPPLPSRVIKPGERYAGAPRLRTLLRAFGDLSKEGTAAAVPDLYDVSLSRGVARFQARHGLDPDGTLGRETLRALTVPIAQRVRQIELTLERWRWLPTFDRPPIIVNIPEFRLFAFRSLQDRKADILQMDVIVGRAFPSMRTPIFAAEMRYVIFRPYWDVPYSITLKEMLPELQANPKYFSEQHLEIVEGERDDSPVVPPIPENIARLARGELRLRQQPGPDNALGLVKFMLPNPYNVYLHSTPARRLFAQSRRAFSHGCIRVSDPVSLAVHVLRDTDGAWTAEAITSAIDGSQTRRVTLAHSIPVLIVYGTALATESGPILFFDDLYGHDRKLEQLLNAHASEQPAARIGVSPYSRSGEVAASSRPYDIRDQQGERHDDTALLHAVGPEPGRMPGGS